MNSNTDRYNGWANYETWNYALWLDNEQASQEYWSEQAQEFYDNADDPGEITDPQIRAYTRTRKENATNALADRLQQDAENYTEQTLPSCNGWMVDAVNTYLGEIDWYEIAEHYLADITEEEETSK